jgi:type II secretion system protein N
MKKFSNIIIYVLVAIFSFGFFLYLSFPYNVLKETISIEISNAIGVSLGIKDLGPRFPLGLKADGVKLSSASGQEIELRNVSVQVSILSLLAAKVQTEFTIVDAAGGSIELGLGFGIFDLISGTRIPSSVELVGQNFSFGDLVQLALKIQAAKPGTSPFIRPIMEKMSIVGKFNSKIAFAVNTSDFSRSTGTMDISLVETNIEFDPSMQIPGQKFDSAVIKANSQGGTFTFDPSSRFKTKDLNIVFTGKVIEKAKSEQSILDVEIKLEIFKELKNTFGVIFNAIAGKDIEGKLSIKISGPVIPGPEIQIL